MSLEGVSKLCFLTTLSLSCAFAVTPPIGVVSAIGTFTVNDAKVEGNANVFEGSLIKTTTASGRVYLETGSQLTLGTNSAATFYKDRVVLQQGATRVDGTNRFSIQAASYRIQNAEPASEAVVRLEGDEVQIAALVGAVNVYNGHGALLTRVGAGTASSFDNQNSGAPTNVAANNSPKNPQSGATAGQSGASAGQSGATAQTGAAAPPGKTKLYITLGVALAGLGLATDAILQPGTPAPTSP